MAGSKSNYLENKINDHVLGGPDYTRPANVFVGLFTVAPDDTGGGTEITGLAGYARAQVVNNQANWPNSVNGVKSNGAAITFAAAEEDWGTIVAAGVFDALTGGNLLYWGTLTNAKQVDTDDIFSIPIGGFSNTED